MRQVSWDSNSDLLVSGRAWKYRSYVWSEVRLFRTRS